MGSGHQFQGDVSPTPTSNSQTPAWCPTIQLMADTPDSIWSHTEGSVLQECPYAPLQRPTTSLSRQLGFWLTAYRSEVLMTPFLALIILLEWLTKLIKTFCTLCYQFIMKGYNSEAARHERCTEQSRGRGCGAPVPSKCSPYVSRGSPTLTLPELVPLGLDKPIKASLHRHNWWHCWSLVPELNLSLCLSWRSKGWDLKFQPSEGWMVLPATSPHPVPFPVGWHNIAFFHMFIGCFWSSFPICFTAFVMPPLS